MDQFAEMLKGFGAASPVLLLLWLDRNEKRNDLKAEQAKNAALQAEIIVMMKDAIKSDLTSTLVLEKIADKVGA